MKLLKRKVNIDDREEVSRLKAGDSRAFRLLYDKYAPKVFGFAFSYFKSREKSEEIVQEAFLKIWNDRGSLQPDLSFNSYLLTISRNLIVDCIRRNSIESFFKSDLVKRLASEYNHVENEVNVNELQGVVNDAINNLPAKRRKIFTLVRRENVSYNEISNRLGVSKKTIEAQMNKAHKAIRSYLHLHYRYGTFLLPFLL